MSSSTTGRASQNEVKGRISLADGSPATSILVVAFDRDLRSEQELSQARTGRDGTYLIRYDLRAAASSETGRADLVVKAFSADGAVLAASPILFNAPPVSVVDLTIAADVVPPPSRFEAVGMAIVPLLDGAAILELDELAPNLDVSFLAGETGLDTTLLGRFILAHHLAEKALPAEFWFALLGRGFFVWADADTMASRLAMVSASLSSLDDVAVERALTLAFTLNDIPAGLQKQTPAWLKAFDAFMARRAVSATKDPGFLQQALDHAGVETAASREAVAQLLGPQQQLTAEAAATLEKNGMLTSAQIADVQASFQLADITNSGFDLVKAIKDHFDVRSPDAVRALARQQADEWVNLVTAGQKAGTLTLPIEIDTTVGKAAFPTAEVYGAVLARQIQQAFPTTAFAGGLARAVKGGTVPGLSQGSALSAFLDRHPEFDLARTMVDDFLTRQTTDDDKALAANDIFRHELKAAQRLHKLAWSFEASAALLTDGIHSARQIYRVGESAFVRRYGRKAGFTPEDARRTWRRAADTHAAVLTIVGDLKSLDGETLPKALQNDNQALSTFPDWNNLFAGGDICFCDDCNSVLSPAAYFTDLLMFLKDRETLTAGQSIKDLLFSRRPDLGYLELNCDNALTLLPYVDVVCEVLEAVVAAGADDRELQGFTAMPADPATAVTTVAAALAAAQLEPGSELTVSQVNTANPDLWVAHGNVTTFLLKKKTTPNFFAQILPNTKADADQLQAYPQYVSTAAYETLRQARYPSVLPFDLFGEEVRATFVKSDLERWNLMGLLKTGTGPTDGEIAAEYFGIGVDAAAPMDEKRLILVADTTDAGQQAVWGETGNATWLVDVGNVKTFLQKTGLAYEDMGALLDLAFINPAHDIVIQYLDASCDIGQQVLQGLDATKLDRIHRFLRLWRKLDGWQMWEVDLALRCAGIGAGTLDEPCLVNLFYFDRLKTRLGSTATVEALCSLLQNLNVETRFTQFLEPRALGYYQDLFLNKRLIQPLDPALAVAAVDVLAPTTEKITGHRPAILAVLGVSDGDIGLVAGLAPLTDDLTLGNLTLLWRHTWLAKTLKLSVKDWVTTLALQQQGALTFATAHDAWSFVDRVDQLRATGFTVDQLDWILLADRTARAATTEADASRFLGTLRTALQAIQTQYSPAQYPFLDPPSDNGRLTALLRTLLQQLHRDDAGSQTFLDTLADQVSLAAPVTGMPAGFTFPAPIAATIPIVYDAAAGLLHFTGLMSSAQQTTLTGDPSLSAVTGNASYQAAIAELFDQPRLALKFLDPVFTAPLATLPGTLDFAAIADPELARKISYDPEARALTLVGILTAKDKATLNGLSADPAYQDAIDSLYTQPTTGTFAADVLWLQDADLQFPLRNLANPVADNLNRNLATAISKALVHVSRNQSETTVVKQASAALNLPEDLTRSMLSDYPLLPDTLLALLTGSFAASSGAVDYATVQPVFDGWYWAIRVAALWQQWKVTLAEWQRVQDLATAAQLLDIVSLPINAGAAMPPTDHMVRTARVFGLRDSLPEPGLTFLELLANLHAGHYASVAAFAADVAEVDDAWAATDVQTLVGLIDATYPADYLLAETWERVRQTFAFARHLNAGMATLATLAGATMGATQAATVKGLLRSRLDPVAWQSLSTDIQDGLRERKRDALNAYLLSQPMPAAAPSGKWEDTTDLYAYYLLDVEMGACQLTSRLVQASGSIQLLVQRCLLGIEPQVTVNTDDDSAWNWWDWMRKYRVWEANRQVFLWPENWIEPELRIDSSEIFKELQQDLLQSDVTGDTAETALTNYLEKLHGIAHLEIAGFYQEDDGDDGAVVHVFGRTSGADPQVYYYRRYDYQRWTPWEKVNLDIQGDYLSPAVVNKRLYLFWPVFTEDSDEAGNSVVPTPVANESGFQVKQTVKSHKVQLAMSDYRQGAWTQKKISKDYYRSSWITVVDSVPKYYQVLPIDRTLTDGRFHVTVSGYSLGSDEAEQAELFATFEIGGCAGIPRIVSYDGGYKPAITPEWASVGQFPTLAKFYTDYMKWDELGQADEFGNVVYRHDLPQDDFTLQNNFTSDKGGLYTTVLLRTPWFFRMTPPWQLSYTDQLVLDGKTFPVSTGPSARSVGIPESPVPVGSWLPFFYNDKKRTFFVVPALAVSKDDGKSLVLEYYPDIQRAIRTLEGLYKAKVQAWLDSLDLTTMTSAQRQTLDTLIYEAFPEEAAPPENAPPPYTPAEAAVAEAFLVRLVMRVIHGLLGKLALVLFQNRRLQFKNFYHPFVCAFIELAENPLLGIPAMYKREVQLQDSGFSFRQQYQPTPAVIDPSTEAYYPREMVDFTLDGSYAPYNWELFFHIPLLIADALSQNQQFEEARNWYHFIFNPIGVESATPGGSVMSKYWITKPFYETTDPQYVEQRIENILRMLAGDTTAPDYSPALRQALEAQVLDWRNHPFDPHRIASYRTVAYQKTVVMKYLDNLIAWGDNLFRQDSMESINEATQYYLLAAELLGPKPMKVPPRAKPPLETFNELEASLDSFSNALVQVENIVPPQSGGGSGGSTQAPLPMLYFCVPQNDKLLGYWDTVADRLYKIRHCMNIEGVTRQLALFEPPIDPGLLVKATAAGIDIGSALNGIGVPLPIYRFQILLQKANEACNDIKALGGALLSALEAQDAEALSRIRQGQEISLLQAMRMVKEQQLDEANANLAATIKGQELAQDKQIYYASRELMNTGEALALALSVEAAVMNAGIELGYAFAGTMRSAMPQWTFGGAGFGGSPVATATEGGETLGDAMVDANKVLEVVAQALDKAAATAATLAGYQRRQDDWTFQAEQAGIEIEQAVQAVAAAQVRVAIAQKELDNHDLQIANSQAVDAFMRSKYTNRELFQWQVGQISQVFFLSYQLAYDLASKAERCFRFELGLADSSYITFGYWDSLKRGLMSGEKLQYDLRRMESAYLDQNRREYELSKNVSLLQLDPQALVQLRETGRCFFDLPEEVFDLDYPGHYFREIKSASMTLPCLGGRYITMACTLRLLRNSIRINTDLGSGYPRNTDGAGHPADDARFVENNLPVNAIATSSAQNDSGMFELNFRDDRYLPFEGAGAISSWSLELFNDPSQPDFGRPLRQFDYGTITDAVLHLKYMAREDSGPFKIAAISHLRDYFSQDSAALMLMLNLRRDFSSQWSRFLNPANPADGNVFQLDVTPTLFPIRDGGKTLKIISISALARGTYSGGYKAILTPPLADSPPGGNTIALTQNPAYGALFLGQRDVSAAAVEVPAVGTAPTWQVKLTRSDGTNLTVDPVTNLPEVQDLMLILGYVWN